MPPLRSTGPTPEAERQTGQEQPEHAGQYRLGDCLGSGGMGVVHLATSASGLRLAIKVVHAEHASDPEFRARFRQEVAAARRVSGAFTAPVVDADPDAPLPWMATLFIDGLTLAERVKRNGSLDLGELRRLGAGLAEALRDIHRAGVVHRDLKPSNVLLAADGPKVIDFGISRPSDSDLRTETGKLIGTPPFMAPEQFQRPREVGPAADVFALGAVLVHAATGRGPFGSDSPYIVAYQVVHNEPDLAGVPAELIPLLTRCLAKEPGDRPAPGEVMAELRSPVGEVDTAFLSLAPADPPDSPDRPGGSDGPDEPEPEAGTGSGAVTRRSARLRMRYAAVGLAAAGLLTAAYAGIRVTAPDPAQAPAGDGAGARGAASAPWQSSLTSGTATAAGGGESQGSQATPACASDGSALYCSASGVMAARLSLVDGARLWSREAPVDAGTADRAPVLSDGLLYVSTNGGRRLDALDPETGATRWGRDLGAYAPVVFSQGMILLMGPDGTVRALDGASGAERWRARSGGPGTQWMSTPGEVFAVTPAADGRNTLVRVVAADSGEVRWEKRLKGVLTPVAVDSPGTDRLPGALLLTEDRDGFANALVRLDPASREVRRVPLPLRVDQAQVAASGGVVYVVGAGGALMALDAEAGGAQRWRLETYLTRSSQPVVQGGRVYLSGADGRLLAVDAERGALLGQTRPRTAGAGAGATVASALPAPVAVGRNVFASAPDGSVLARVTADPPPRVAPRPPTPRH
ncbi:PQQ-binding-like beta-propeller repeat protein, partial [Streptomyces sp. NPDC127084]|uniref:protein kinase domain-containing protein n=1 Tax=Streptomyces sp. NPDC127084 TaxID=3347133 RepID=UPI00364C183F